MRRNRRVKIVATLGPASNNEETMRRLFEAGADVFRVNMSHATHAACATSMRRCAGWRPSSRGPSASWSISRDQSSASANSNPAAIRLTEGDVLSFDHGAESVGGRGACTCRIPRSSRPSQPGHTMLLDDGKFSMRVVGKSSDADRRRGDGRRHAAAARASACQTPCCRSAP